MNRRTLALMGQSFRLYLTDSAPLIVYVLMPLGLMAFFAPSSQAVLRMQGFSGASGAEQAIPGMTVMFSLMMVSNVGMQFYREYGWGTWNRVRIAAKSHEILAGKLVPALVILLAQTAIVFVSGALLFGLHVSGSLLALVLVILAFSLCALALAAFVIAWCTTLDQLMVLANLSAMLLSGLGGAFAPVSALPSWAQTIAPATPAYWAIEGMRKVILESGGLSEAAPSILVLVLFSAGLFVLASLRFNMKDVKIADT